MTLHAPTSLAAFVSSPGPRKVDVAQDGVDSMRALLAATEPGAAWDALERCRHLLSLVAATPATWATLTSHNDASSPRAESELELVVDLERNVVSVPALGKKIVGRPLLCAVLAQLTPSVGRSPERLFYDVWGGREYHPLRHRNTIYVAIMRLRRALADVVPGREIVETMTLGWRLAPGVIVRVIGDDRGARASAGH